MSAAVEDRGGADTKDQCRACGSGYVRRAHFRWFELPLKLFWEPYRCRNCRLRFWRRRRRFLL